MLRQVHSKPVHADADKKSTQSQNDPKLALLLTRSEKNETNNNGQTGEGKGNVSVRRSNRIFEPPGRLGSVP